jgi:hypothetical protein
MRKYYFLSVSILIIFSLLCACNYNQSPTSDLSSNETIETAYPFPDNIEGYTGTSYPVGQEPPSDPIHQLVGTIEPSFVPESDPNNASVYGVLTSFTDKEPLQGVVIYVADVVIVETSGDKIYTTQEKSSPHDATDDIGQFTISQIKPGNYLLMLVTPFGSYPIFDKDYIQVEIELKAGDVIYFDEVFVNWP